MARGGTSTTKPKSTTGQTSNPNPESDQRNKLRKLAIKKDIISETPGRVTSSLNPSKTVAKHNGRDLLRKSNRKNRFLFSFPGLIGPVSSGGKIGELKNLGSKNPILYLDFPQGRMKLFGTIVYPKNRYLTLQFSKGGKNVTCDDYFDNMIVFSDAWWIGTKEENPEETQLSFPENMNVEQKTECEFQGGAGSTGERIQAVNRSKVTNVRHESPETEVETDFSDSEIDPKDLSQPTPTRHSTRTSGKRYKFAESSSADDAIDLDIDTDSSDAEDKEVGASLISESKDDIKTEVTKVSAKTESSISATKAKDGSNSKFSLVQATISTLFKKQEEKEEKMAIDSSPHPKSSKVIRKKMQELSSEEKVDPTKAGGSKQKGKAVKESKTGTKKSTPRKKKPKISDDEIEEISDPSEDSSDEDWGA
ncbi:DNA-binding protein RHL1 isoform X1 [Tanacetum coccineum]